MAPKKYRRIERGVPPSRTSEEKAARAERSVEFSSPDQVKSFICCGLRPSGPPVDSAGNAFITSASNTTDGGEAVGVGGIVHLDLSFNADRVALFEAPRVFLEHAK